MGRPDGSWTAEALLGAFDEHLRRVRGLCPGTRRNYARHVQGFLEKVSADGVVDPKCIGVDDVVDFIEEVTRRYRERTVELAATSLRSLFRFLRSSGLRDDRLEDAVPTVPHRTSSLLRHLSSTQLARLIGSLESVTPRDLRDKAIVLCLARLGLRASEVVQLELDDVDWRAGSVHVRRRKTGHGALLPLPGEIGEAVATYLQLGRPDTPTRRLFVLHWLRVGAPISDSIVGRAVERSLRRAGISAPTCGANLLRHSLATDLLAGGATLPEIADVMGHRSLATTGIYARVDVAALTEVGLPWPVVTS